MYIYLDTCYRSSQFLICFHFGVMLIVCFTSNFPFLISLSMSLKSGGNNPTSLNLRRFFSSNEKHLPAISDPQIESAFKDLLAASWNELPHGLVEEAKKAVSKATDDKAGQEALENVFRAAEACEEFGGTLVTLRMALDDLCGLTGEVSICYLEFFLCTCFFFSFCA